MIEQIKPMTVRQVFYQATVQGLIEKSEVQTDLALMRRKGELPYKRAAVAASRFIKQLGVAWHDVLGRADDTRQSRPPVPDDDDDLAVAGRWPCGWCRLVSDGIGNGQGILADWELGFCANYSTLRNFSSKQAAILRRLADKLVLEGAFA